MALLALPVEPDTLVMIAGLAVDQCLSATRVQMIRHVAVVIKDGL